MVYSYQQYCRLKCDRGRPCANCLKRGQDTACQYLTERSQLLVSAEQRSHNVYNRLQLFEQKLLRLKKTAIWDHSSKSELVGLDGSETRDTDATDDIPQAETESAAAARLISVSGCLVSEGSNPRSVDASHWLEMMNNAVSETTSSCSWAVGV